MTEHAPAEPVGHRKPGALDLAAGALIVGTVVLHVVAMFPSYFAGGGQQSLAAQTDQAALYAVLAASWALALAFGLTGPARTPVAAGLAVGVAATELGFRVSDLGQVLRYGTSTAGTGLWLMEAAWVVGAVAALVAVWAARRRHRRPAATSEAPTPEAAPFPEPAPSPLGASPVGASPVGASPVGASPVAASPVGAEPGDATSAIPTPGSDDATAAFGVPHPEPRSGDTLSLQALHGHEDPSERTAWTLLVVVLALVTAGAFLPAWDHAVAVSSVTGQSLSRSLGNAFSGPWQQVVGTVLAGAAMLLVPIVAVRLRNRAVGAAAACGALLVLASQLVAAVVQVDQPVSPAEIGIGASQAQQLGLHIALELTGWFTVDALAAYALFAAVMVWATLRAVGSGSGILHEYSGGIRPATPPWSSESTSGRS